jgi:sugar O-acyltransferase (sialic acid O-acetyltransferase NeuD family)
MIISKILVPLLNANEPEARLVAVRVTDRQAVTRNTVLFTLETTKAATDVDAPEAGYIHLIAKEGDTLLVGDTLGILTDSADEVVDIDEKPSQKQEEPRDGSGTLRITKPAQRLAETIGLDLSTLPSDRLITEDIIREIIRNSNTTLDLPDLSFSEKPSLIVFGGGGHAKSLIDLVKQNGEYSVVGIVDDKMAPGAMVLGVPVLGGRAILPGLTDKGVKMAANGVGGILDINIRLRIFDLLVTAGFTLPALVHPRATVEPSALINSGVQVFANAYIGSEAKLNSKCMVNTNAVVSHDCVIGSYSHVAPGALLAGHVEVGDRTLVGMGVTTAIGIKIGSGVRIGNGAIILADVPDRTIIQAGRYWVGKTETP